MAEMDCYMSGMEEENAKFCMEVREEMEEDSRMTGMEAGDTGSLPLGRKGLVIRFTVEEVAEAHMGNLEINLWAIVETRERGLLIGVVVSKSDDPDGDFSMFT